MPREQFQTLSEPMYYILLSLAQECCGVDIMKKVTELSNNRISVGPGTLYTLLSRFEETGAIKETKMLGRKRSYVITQYGRELLKEEYERLQVMLEDGREIMEGF